MLTITIGTESFTLTDGQVKAINVELMDITEYVKNVLTMKAWQQAHKIVLLDTDKNPKKLGQEELDQIVLDSKVLLASERPIPGID